MREKALALLAGVQRCECMLRQRWKHDCMQSLIKVVQSSHTEVCRYLRWLYEHNSQSRGTAPSGAQN
jgi:hypothetical protein